MGVYNPKMAMPETCRECGVTNCGNYDPDTWRIKRHKDCPLIEVPDGHGRLIDADALREEWLENGENEYVYDTNSFLDSIDDAPTIIPADKEEI